jgi:hypothetical protein
VADLLQGIKIRAGYELTKLSRKPFKRFLSPFNEQENAPKIIHCCYHKVGTVWFGRILRRVAAEYALKLGAGRNYKMINDFEKDQNADMYLDFGSHVDLDQLPNYVGSHMIRDPRDMIVSGYFYHKWTKESWANLGRAEFKGRTYVEYLNSIDQDAGLCEEIKRVSFWVPHMTKWNFNNPKMFEIRYETIIKDEQSVFREMFKHYGFSDKAVDRCCGIAEKLSIKNLKKKRKKNKEGRSHLRSGRTGEWKELFKDHHKQLFKELYPNAVVVLGYENNDDW